MLLTARKYSSVACWGGEVEKSTLDLVIPVLNEQDLLSENVKKIVNFIDCHIGKNFKCNVYIVDNGSTDLTPKIAKNLESDLYGKVYYRRVDKRGVGLALKSIWSESKADYIGYMDLDLATDLKYLPVALNALAYQGADMVYASRLHERSKVAGRSVKRELVSRVFNSLLRLYLNVKFSDGMCGFKFLKRECISDIMKNGAMSDGWFFCTEILVVSEWMGLKLYELPVSWTDAPNSKVKVIPLALEYVKAMKNLKSYRVLIK